MGRSRRDARRRRGQDRIFTLTPGSDFGHWIGDSRWTKSYGFARCSTGVSIATNGTSLYRVDDRRYVTALSGIYNAASFGSIAFGAKSQAWGRRLYVGEPAANRLSALDANGLLQSFATRSTRRWA